MPDSHAYDLLLGRAVALDVVPADAALYFASRRDTPGELDALRTILHAALNHCELYQRSYATLSAAVARASQLD